MQRIAFAGWLALAGLVAAATVAPPAVALPTDPYGGTGGGPLEGTLHVRVVHSGTADPFAGAFVMVGPAPNVPFADNYGTTSGAGELTFTDPALQGPLAVTAAAPGHGFFTLIDVDASDLVIPLAPLTTGTTTYEVGDGVGGIDVDNGAFHVGDGNVDLAVVLPALALEDLLRFDPEGLFGPLETIEILGEPIEIPSNVYLPQQWELFVEIVKDHYYLYLEEGAYTLTALSGRVPNDVLLAGGDITQLLGAIEWREADLLDIEVSGNLYSADLHVDPDLSSTVTLNLDHIPAASTSYCISAGDLDGLSGLGRLVPLGIDARQCAAGGGPCSETVQLTTTAASGEFTGMTYFPAVAVDLNESDDVLVLLDRTPRPQTYTATLASFFQPLTLDYDAGVFAYSDAQNPTSGSPPVDLHIARLVEPGTNAIVWELMVPGDGLAFELPLLPAEAPVGPTPGAEYTWEHLALALTFELSGFDFNAFALSDITAHGSHLALDQTPVAFAVAAGLPEPDAPSLLTLHAAQPNPFVGETAIAFRLAEARAVDLAVCTLAGRRIATLARGQYAPGDYRVSWNGRDARGHRVPSGVYWVQLQAGDMAAGSKLLRVR